MSIEQLQTILQYADVVKKEKVYIQVHSKGMKQNCEIESFGTHSDGIVFNVVAFDD